MYYIWYTLYKYIMQYCATLRKGNNLQFAVMWLELDDVMPKKVSPKERKKVWIILPICGM